MGLSFPDDSILLRYPNPRQGILLLRVLGGTHVGEPSVMPADGCAMHMPGDFLTAFRVSAYHNYRRPVKSGVADYPVLALSALTWARLKPIALVHLRSLVRCSAVLTLPDAPRRQEAVRRSYTIVTRSPLKIHQIDYGLDRWPMTRSHASNQPAAVASPEIVAPGRGKWNWPRVSRSDRSCTRRARVLLGKVRMDEVDGRRTRR